MKESDLDMDSTQALLDSTIPDTPDFVDSVIQDSEEDEIFFGDTSTKEKKGRNAKFNRRDTICLSDGDRRRSFDVAKTKSRDLLLSQQTSKGRKSSSRSSRSSLYSQENSIMEEEDEDDCVFMVPTVQVGEISSTVFDECEELELEAGRNGRDSRVQEEQNLSLNVTGRRYRNKKQRNNLKSIVSLPSVSKMDAAMDDISMEGERRAGKDHEVEMMDEGDLVECRRENFMEVNPRLHSAGGSVSSCETGTTESEGNTSQSDLGPELDCSQVSDIPVLECSTVSDMGENLSADTSSVSDGPTDSSQVSDCPTNTSKMTDGEVSGKVFAEGSADIFSKDDSVEKESVHGNTAAVSCSSVLDHTASSDISHVDSTVNSGVVTFKEDTSVSGVYDSFSDDTRDEFIDDTEVQDDCDVDESNVVEGEVNEEKSSDVSSELFNDSEVTKFANVKRNIFEGESDMESFVLGSVASELDSVADNPFTLGSINDDLNSVGNSSFSLGSVVSGLGSVVAGNLGHDGGEMSMTVGDDSVFSRNSLQGHFTLSHSFDVAGEESADETDTDTVDGNEDAAAEESLHDQSEEMESNDIPHILLTRPSLPNNIADDDERSSSPEFLPASPDRSAASVYQTAPTSHNATDLSPMFDTTAEEMMLFEMYGENYDEMVEDMSKQQKLALKDKLANRGEEEITKVAEKLHKIMQEKSRESSIGSTISPFSVASSTPSFQIPPDPSPQPTDPVYPPPVLVENSTLPPLVQNIPKELRGSTECLPESQEFRVPRSIMRYPAETTYLLPTTASLGKMAAISPSPKKPIQTPWMPPSPSPKYSSHSPSKPLPFTATITRPLVSKIPQPVVNTTPQPRVLQSRITPQSGQLHTQTPNSHKKFSRVTGLKAAEYAAVASPVAEYVKSNPAPPLVQNVKAKNCQKDLESTLVEVEEDKENVMERLTMVQACPLPAAVYRSGTLSEEQLVDVTGPEYAYIPEAYGTVNTSAKVTKHVARVRVGQAQAGLKWNENCLVNDESLNSSPSVAKFKAPAKSVLKQTRRDSGLFDESMLEMSVHETKVVKKMARGRGRGKK